MRGVWLSGFERSSFLAGAQTMPKGPEQYGNAVWVDFAEGSAPDPALRAEMDRMGGTVAVAIDFDGRRSRDAGHYGHMGGADHVVVIDHIRSARILRSEEHTSELQSLMRISYAVFCLKKKKNKYSTT